jgi:hypothetical protein
MKSRGGGGSGDRRCRVAEAGERGFRRRRGARCSVWSDSARDASSIADGVVGTVRNHVGRSRPARGNHRNERESRAEPRIGERPRCAKPSERKNGNGNYATLPSGLARLLEAVIRA